MNRRKFILNSIASSAVCAAFSELPCTFAEAPGAPALEPLPQALQQKLAHDILRPQFHLLPRHNWMNDPCAPRFYRGEYHMFFQYNPNAAVWGDMHWNHATSPDMIHWTHQPVAIAPGPSAFDSYGIFTGSVLPGMDVPTILYTGVGRVSPDQATIRGESTREVQCFATSTDPMLRVWKKLEKPVISAPPEGVKVTGFRDPCPWQDGDTWYLGVGSGFDKVGGAVLLYTSKDGHDWTYLHPLAQGKWNGGTQKDPVDTGEMWECPDFFPLGDKHVLLYSTERKVYWNVGVFDRTDLRFHSETSGLLDHGAYYAMKSMVDAKGRRILWGWVTEKRPDEALKEAGWAGCMALPRVLSIGSDNMLRMEVPQEFASLHNTVGGQQSTEAPSAAWLEKRTITNRAAYVAFTFQARDVTCGIELRAGDAAEPLLSIVYTGVAGRPVLMIGDNALKLSPDGKGSSNVEVWIDGSVAEIFVDKREVMTARIYKLTTGDIRLAWHGAPAALQSISVSSVKPISPDRLTT